MTEFQEAIYEAVIFSYGKTLAKYNVFDQELILRNVGKDLLLYLNDKGFPFKEAGDIQDVEGVISFFVENGFASIEVRSTPDGDQIKWSNLFGRDAYEKLQSFTENPFLSCPLNAVATYIANKHSKSLVLRSKDFSASSGEVTSIETIADQVEGDSQFSPLVIENVELIKLADQKNLELERVNKELKDLQQKYIQAQKMEAVGTLVGGVAHNFNNLLAAIIGKAYLAKKDIKPEARDKHITDIEQLGSQAGEMISQLLVFSRAHSVDKQNVSLTAVYKEAIKLAQLGLSEDISVIANITDDDLYVTGNINELQQLLINLLANAKDAIENTKNKIITITLLKSAAFACEHAKSCTMCGLEAEAATLIIEDSGIGIKDEDLKHIFDPFFTTKEVGKGTGLGLATAYGTVESHGGNIEVSSKPNEGTKFTVCFPLSSKERSSNNLDARIVEGDSSSTILVVDDDDMFRETLAQILISLGYNVLTASDGVEAVDVYKKNIDLIGLVLSDVIMPNLGGCEALREMKRLTPSLPVILITGYSESALRNELDCSNLEVLMKPIDIPTLSKKVSEALSK